MDTMSMEERIDRALAAVGGAELPAGMEGRVLARLAEVRGSETGRWRGVWAACACLGLVVAAGAPLVRMDRRPRVLAPASERSVPRVVASASLTAASKAVPLIRPRGLTVLVIPRRGDVVSGRAGDERDSRSNGRSRGESADEIAMSEMLAPSLPAPAQPLTAQERLLLRMGHAPGAAALAEQDPEQDAALLAAQAARQAEVHELFAAFGKGLFAGMSEAATDAE